MYEYLQDSDFLLALDREKLRTHWARITVLNFQEEPIREIQGIISAGNLTVNGSAAIRRTISLTMVSTDLTNDIENLDNLISIDKKIKVDVGLSNPFKQYSHYGEIIWFPCGVFIISGATLSNSTTGCTININGKDKMTQLDGTVGGTLPASVSFHQIEVEDESGKIFYEYPTIPHIIREAVYHYGNEDESKIVINDLEETAKLLIKYKGTSPLWLRDDSSYFYIGDSRPNDNNTQWKEFYSGQDIGYKKTDFTYPGELILSAGDTVVTLLDKIVTTLGGNYEYYYDVWGTFIFQEKRNYLNTAYTVITNLNGEQYIKDLTDTKFVYSFKDLETITAITKSPSFDNIKNDFICWGTRKVSDSVSIGIRYHLAIDNKPILDLCLQEMIPIYSAATGQLIRYDYGAATLLEDEKVGEEILPAIPWEYADWREELYRRALVNQINSVYEDSAYYDEELLAEWRKLYDPTNENWTKDKNEYWGWNPDVYLDPSALVYWLDFIDDGSEISRYSVQKIGRRTKVNNAKDISIVYANDIPDVIFVLNTDENRQVAAQEYVTTGQSYVLYTEQQENYFLSSSSTASAFENVREMLYQNLTYNTSINITCLPIYYLEPNSLIYVQDDLSHIQGSFAITQFTLPLAYNGTMSITAQQCFTRI